MVRIPGISDGMEKLELIDTAIENVKLYSCFKKIIWKFLNS